MIILELERHVAVIGFGAAGKTTRSRDTATKLSVPPYDNDSKITELDPRKRLSAQIIEEEGFPRFRQYEQAALESILNETKGINAAGGGIIETEATRERLKKLDIFVVYLEVDFDTAMERARNDPDPTTNKRPVLNDAASARETFDRRGPLYLEVADAIVDASQSPEKVTLAMIQHINADALR